MSEPSEITVYPRCGKVKLRVFDPRKFQAARYEWQTPEPCFQPRLGLVINNEECPGCAAARGERSLTA
jgi:hypothetical protein